MLNTNKWAILKDIDLTLWSLNNHYHLHSQQAANCCRNSRLVVNEDDLMWIKNVRKLPCISKPASKKFSFLNLGCWKSKSVFRDVKWCFNASWWLKGLKRNSRLRQSMWDFAHVDCALTDLRGWPRCYQTPAVPPRSPSNADTCAAG